MFLCTGDPYIFIPSVLGLRSELTCSPHPHQNSCGLYARRAPITNNVLYVYDTAFMVTDLCREESMPPRRPRGPVASPQELQLAPLQSTHRHYSWLMFVFTFSHFSPWFFTTADLCLGAESRAVPDGPVSFPLLFSQPPGRGAAKPQKAASFCKPADESGNGPPWDLFCIVFSCPGE